MKPLTAREKMIAKAAAEYYKTSWYRKFHSAEFYEYCAKAAMKSDKKKEHRHRYNNTVYQNGVLVCICGARKPDKARGRK